MVVDLPFQAGIRSCIMSDFASRLAAGALLLIIMGLVVWQIVVVGQTPEMQPLEAVHRRTEFREDDFRLVGIVVGAVDEAHGVARFVVTDGSVEVEVVYTGELPDDLVPGAGVGVVGRWVGDDFVPSSLDVREVELEPAS